MHSLSAPSPVIPEYFWPDFVTFLLRVTWQESHLTKSHCVIASNFSLRMCSWTRFYLVIYGTNHETWSNYIQIWAFNEVFITKAAWKWNKLTKLLHLFIWNQRIHNIFRWLVYFLKTYSSKWEAKLATHIPNLDNPDLCLILTILMTTCPQAGGCQPGLIVPIFMAHFLSFGTEGATVIDSWSWTSQLPAPQKLHLTSTAQGNEHCNALMPSVSAVSDLLNFTSMWNYQIRVSTTALRMNFVSLVAMVTKDSQE